MTRTKVNVGAKALSVILALAMILSMVPVTVFAAGYATQGDGLAVYMVSPKDVTYDESKSTDAYYYNKIGTPFEAGSDTVFKIAFGKAPGINNMDASVLNGNVGVYEDAEGKNQVAASSDFTLTKESNTAWPDVTATDVGRRGVTVTMTLKDGKLSYGKTYYLIIENFSTSGGQGTADIGKKIIFEFSVDLRSDTVSGVKLDTNKLIFEGVGTTYTLTPTVSPATATNKNVTYSSTNSDVAKVDSTGKITAVSAGTAKIVVTTEDQQKTDVCNVTVKASANNRVLKPVEGSQPLVLVGTGLTYTIMSPRVLKDVETGYNVIADTVEAGKIPSISFAFSSNGGKKSSVFHLSVYDNSEFKNAIFKNDYTGSPEFTYTPDQSLFENGKTYYVVIDKTSQSGLETILSDVVVTFTVGATADVPDTPTEYLVLDEQSVEVSAGNTYEIGVSTNIENLSVSDLVWTSSNESVATVSNGVITAVANGDAVITVSTKDGKYSDKCDVKVVTVHPKSIALNKEGTVNLTAGKTLPLSVTFTPENTSNKNVLWSSSNEAVATVENGVVTAKSDVEEGSTAVITATSVDGSLEASVTVAVYGTTPKQVDGYYQVYTPEQLLWISQNAPSGTGSYNVKLMSDINLASLDNWKSITTYKDIFDGNGHTINVYLKNTAQVSGVSRQAGGVFNVLNGATVKDLKITGELTAARQFGGLCYQAGDNTVIERVINYANVSVTGNSYIAGLVAFVNGTNVVIKDCANYGNISSVNTTNNTGGIVGTAQGGLTVINCYNRGTISVVGDNGAGGIIGYSNANSATRYTKIFNCYNAGNIEALSATKEKISPIVGSIGGDNTTVKNCYYDGTMCQPGANTESLWSEIHEKATLYMKSEDFINDLSGSGETINRAYVAASDDYPVFRWMKGNDSATITNVAVTAPNKTEYDVHETIDTTGMVVVASYSDGTSEALLSKDYTYTPSATPDVSDTKITITLNDGVTTLTTPITVYKYPLVDFELTKKPSKTRYDGKGEAVDLNKAQFLATFEKDGRKVEVTLSGTDVTPAFDTVNDTVTSIPVSYTYEGVTKTVEIPIINLSNRELVSIALNSSSKPKQFILSEGDTVDTSGLAINATYKSGTETYTQSKITTGFTVSPQVISKDTDFITISYTFEGTTKTLDIPIINLSDLTFESVSIDHYRNHKARPSKYAYNIGDEPDLTGLVLTLNYKSGELDYTQDVTEGFTVSPAIIKADTKALTISYTMDGITKSTEMPIIVNKLGDPVKNADGFYEIYDEYQFDWFANYVLNKDTSANAILMADLDLTRNRNFIGTHADSNADTYQKGKYYSGTFDGNGHSVLVDIRPVLLKDNDVNTTYENAAVFNTISGATIKNLTVNGSVRYGVKAAGIVSQVAGGDNKIINCVNNANVSDTKATSTTATYSGGIVGYASGTSLTITDCINNGKISNSNSLNKTSGYENSGYGYLGGIIGGDDSTTLVIERCANFGEIIDGSNLGGIIGNCTSADAKIDSCANFGLISNEAHPTSGGNIAGIVGDIQPNRTAASVKNCYNAGEVRTDSSKVSNTAGIVGFARAMLENCYNSGMIHNSGSGKSHGAIVAIKSSGNDTKMVNCYYLEGTAEYAAANSAEHDGIKALSSSALKKAAGKLGDAFINDAYSIEPVNNGYPALLWQASPTAIEFESRVKTVHEGDEFELTVYVTPDGAKLSGDLTWKSSDETVATVENGIVKALSKGSVKITAVTEDGLRATITLIIECNHRGVFTLTKEPTCTEDGEQSVVCSKCGEVIDSYVVPATGHIEIPIEAVEPTCTEDGHTEGSICLICGEEIVSPTVIPATGHTFDREVVSEKTLRSKATATELATYWYTCNDCDEISTTQYFEYGELLPTGWQQVDGKWYYFDANGDMLTGWQAIGGKWYYLGTDGVMVTGWAQVSGKWYYFASSGAMVTGWAQVSGKWYYFASSGAMVTGWAQVSGKWYYFASSGAMVTGWQAIGGKWYYFNASGAMLTGTQKINGKTYKFNSSGVWIS